MRILYITLENISLHKGSVVHIKEVVRGLRELGHKIGLIALGWDQIDIAEHFYNLHLSRFFSQFRFKKQPFLISSFLLFVYLIGIVRRYDVIYARDFHTVIIALFPRIIFRKKLVFEMNGIASEEQWLKSHSILNRLFVYFVKRSEKMATKYSESIISVTPEIRHYLTQYFNCSSDKVNVIANGVNIKEFYPIHDKALLVKCKKRLGIAEEEIVIAFVGNLAPWQGVEYLIQVAPLLLKKIENIRFLIIGDGKLKNEFKWTVNKLRLSNHFIFTGMVDYQHIPLYINIADICVLPKRRLKSGYSPIKLYEYMACGKPVVASRIQGLEFIEEERVGQLVEPEDVVGLEKTLYNLIKDPQERINVGERGVQIARERYSWESRVAEIEKVLIELA